MIQKFSFNPRKEGDFIILGVGGYLENTGGSLLKNYVEKCLQEGSLRFIFDFSSIELISSPGVAALLDIGSKVVDDFDGRICVFGLDSHHLAVLEMSGFFFLAAQAGDLASAKVAIAE